MKAKPKKIVLCNMYCELLWNGENRWISRTICIILFSLPLYSSIWFDFKLNAYRKINHWESNTHILISVFCLIFDFSDSPTLCTYLQCQLVTAGKNLGGNENLYSKMKNHQYRGKIESKNPCICSGICVLKKWSALLCSLVV